MCTFDGETLFTSGECSLQVGGLSLRHILVESPGGRGVQLSHLGHHGRLIKQDGYLVADTPSAMQEQYTGIETKLDGQAYTLSDGMGRSWSNTVMLSFNPEPIKRHGARWRGVYEINYVQLTP